MEVKEALDKNNERTILLCMITAMVVTALSICLSAQADQKHYCSDTQIMQDDK